MGRSRPKAGDGAGRREPEPDSRNARPVRYRRFTPKMKRRTLVVARMTAVTLAINGRRTTCMDAWWSARTRHARAPRAGLAASTACNAMPPRRACERAGRETPDKELWAAVAERRSGAGP